MDAPVFQTIARFEDLSEDTPAAAKANGVHLVVLRVGEAARVFHGLCPHAGTPMVTGIVSEGTLTCVAHSWCFDTDTGARVDRDGECLHRFEARVEDGDVAVDMREVGAWDATRRSSNLQGRDEPGPSVTGA